MIYLAPNKNDSSGDTIDILDATSTGQTVFMGTVHIDLFYAPRDGDLTLIHDLLLDGHDVAVNVTVDNQWLQDLEQKEREMFYG